MTPSKVHERLFELCTRVGSVCVWVGSVCGWVLQITSDKGLTVVNSCEEGHVRPDGS